MGLWPLAAGALVPILILAERSRDPTRTDYVVIWAVTAAYWLLSMQGLRHAHPAMYACWIALSAYLACYLPLTVLVTRRLLRQRIPLMLAFPISWVGMECVRNYLLTGISVLMLGHTMANVSAIVQVADVFGTYGVSFVIAAINVAFFYFWKVFRKEIAPVAVRVPLAAAGVMLGIVIGYGLFRINQSTGPPLATFALIQRDEPVEYVQNAEREIEISRAYETQTVDAAAKSEKTIDAVVWPESMFTGGVPWYQAAEDATVPPQLRMAPEQFHEMVRQGQSYVRQRSRGLQEAVRNAGNQEDAPHLIMGTGVIRYTSRPEIYSAVLHMQPGGELGDWYGKTHLVMFGEYVPFAKYIAPLRRRLPAGMGIDVGSRPKRFMVGDTGVSPNICIETAVERVTVNQLAALKQRNKMPDVVVTVTNDGWFDDSSILEHHLRCGQLVAVGTRRPLLSCANNGPTAWVDSCGRVVDRLPTGTNGAVIATPLRDSRTSLYLRIGDWPARLLALTCLLAILQPLIAPLMRRARQTARRAG
jgi:apolipoprotein N-acyltransferase